jgi:hypothetical protein
VNISTTQSAAGTAPLETFQDRQAVGKRLSVPPGTAQPAIASAPAGSPDDVISGTQSASADLQTMASYIQVASGYIGQAVGLLSQMSEAAESAQASSGSTQESAEDRFATLQQTLRGIIGGSAAEIGGSNGSSPALASFGGADIFGSSPGGVAASTSLASISSLTHGGASLRQGAVLSLIGQDSKGAFSMSASDPGAPGTVSAALDQVSSAADAFTLAQAEVDRVSSEAQDPEGNTGSQLISQADASAASRYAAFSVVGQPGAALAAQSGRWLQFGFGLLQAG